MFRNIFLSLALIVAASTAYSQCTVTAYANAQQNTLSICLGDSVVLTGTGSCPNYVLFNDFNQGNAGTGWSATNQAMFTNPCAPHSPDGTIYLWMGSTSTAPRNLTTVNFDVSMGGSIEFEMRYAVQGANSPCEGPDLFDEGIAIQYSVNNGSTWNTIEYYAPNGQILNYIPTTTSPGTSGQTAFTVWTTRVVPIPQAAWTTSTKFRWAQTASTDDIYDHWGLDNVKILVPPPTISVWWDHGPTGYTPPAVFPTANTTYTLYLSDSTDTVSSSVNVIVNPIPTSDFTAVSPVCVGNNSTITYTGTGTANATYSWGFDTGTIMSGSGQGPYQVNWSSGGTYNVTLMLMENGCVSDPYVVPVVVNPNPTPPNISFVPTCEGDNLQLLADTIPGVTYSWIGPSGYTSNVQNPVINGATSQFNAGTYSVAITDANGCVSNLSSQSVTILPLPVVSFTASPTSGCEPLTVNFNNTTSGATTYAWQFGDNGTDATANPTHTYQNDGSYNVTLTVTDNNGCTNQLSNPGMITVHPEPSADFTTNPTVGAPGSQIAFNSSYTGNMGTWTWIFGDGNTENLQVPTTQHVYTEMGTFTVTHIVETQFGCKDTVTKTILVINLTIPNVFTPNGDGINDYFVIDGAEQLDGVQLVVFNRWGKKVYESSNYKNDWDGENHSDGVYYYILTLKDNVFAPSNGTITILR